MATRVKAEIVVVNEVEDALDLERRVAASDNNGHVPRVQ
jgi:hypothetical protein